MKNFDEVEEEIRFSIKKIESYYKGINEDNIDSPKNIKSVDAISWRLIQISRLLNIINGEYISTRCKGLNIDVFDINMLKLLNVSPLAFDNEDIPSIISELLPNLKKFVRNKDKSSNFWDGQESHQTTYKKSIRTVKK